MSKRRKLAMIEYPSPNFNDRRGMPVRYLILHYTATATLQESLDILVDDKRSPKVSCHYLIAENGDVYRMVKEENRAWHAGNSSWGGATDLNTTSIGIEIQNAGGLQSPMPEFPAAQMAALTTLCQQIVKRHSIRAFNVVGHSDIAPDRKVDPGEKFNWKGLAAAGVGVYPAPIASDYEQSASWDDSQVLARLRQYGYGSGTDLKKTITQFQRHFYTELFATPSKVGLVDAETKARLACLLRKKQSADRRIETMKRKRSKTKRNRSK